MCVNMSSFPSNIIERTTYCSWIWDAPQLEAHHHQDKILNPKYMGYKKPLFFIFPKISRFI